MANQLVERLSEASVKKSFDPIKDINWEEPFDLERLYLPERDISLYGTPIYEALTREERVRLSLHEAAGAMATGIWFENILKHKFLDYLYNRDPHDPKFRYVLHEVADECHHSIMFGEFIRRSGAPFYPVAWWAAWAGALMKEAVPKPSVFVGILAAEAILDYFNRSAMNSPEVHPTVRRISQIHVIEEARHISFARDYLVRELPRLSPFRRIRATVMAPVITGVIVSQIVSSQIYADLGLPGEARRQAFESRHRRSVLRQAGTKLTALLGELELVTPSTLPLWRATRLVP